MLERLAGNMTNYPIGDFLIQIKNARLAERREVKTKTSKFIKAVADVLKKQGILNRVEQKDGNLEVELAYHKKEPVLLDLKLVSKPGLRKYMSIDNLKTRKRSKSTFLILSTPHGVMTSDEALKKGTGGEVLVEIW